MSFSSQNSHFKVLFFSEIKIPFLSQLPDQIQIQTSVQALLDGDLRKNVELSYRNVKEIRTEIESIIKSNVPEVKMSINKIGQAMQEISSYTTRQIDDVSDFIGNNTFQHLVTADDYIAQYSIYRYYGGLIISSLLLIVLVFLTFGLLCGICGKRPDGYGDDCCTKGAGSKFLMWYVISLLSSPYAFFHNYFSLLVASQ